MAALTRLPLWMVAGDRPMRGSSDSFRSASGRMPRLVPAAVDGERERIGVGNDADRQFAAEPSRRRLADGVVFEAPVCGEDVVSQLAAVAQLFEFVEVGFLAAVVDHAVDRAGSAENLAARPELGGAVVGPAEWSGAARCTAGCRTSDCRAWVRAGRGYARDRRPR